MDHAKPMPEKIAPALTEAEWAALRIQFIDYHTVQAIIPNISIMPLGGIMQKVAAACLHGQPFGFDHRMVSAIRTAVDTSFDALCVRDINLALNAADRIEALLPPKDARTDGA